MLNPRPNPTLVILIPHWIAETIKRNALNIRDCLNFEKIKPILTAEDIAGFLALQNAMYFVTGAEAAESTHIALYYTWFESASPENQKYLESIVMPISVEPTFVDNAKARLFEEDAKQEHHTEAFITYDLVSGISGIVVYPGYFTKTPNSELNLRAVEAVLELLYVYTPYNEVSKTPWFKRFLELLSAKS